MEPATEPMTCSVCCDVYTKETRKAVACPSCSYEACTRCVKAFLTSTPSEPNCMNCHHAWNREFLDQHLSRSWREGDLKKHRATILFDRERSLMPATQPAVTIEVQKRAYAAEIPALVEEERAIYEKLHAVHAKLTANRFYIRHGRLPGAPPTEEEKEAEKEKRKFVAACPSADCRGFLSTAYKCGTCQVQYCADCREPKKVAGAGAADHACDPALVATMAAIAKECRPCPNCGMGISKVSGCDQMYCTSCDTAYSYETGKVVTGVIHNPHYFERMRALGGALPRQPGDVLCGGWPAWHTLPVTVRTHGILIRLYQMATHVEQVELPKYAPPVDNRDLRVRYLLKEIDEKQLKTVVQQRDRKRQKELEIRGPLELFVISAMEFFQNEPSPAKLPIFAAAVEAHINVPLRSIGDRYANIVPIFDISMEQARLVHYKPGPVSVSVSGPVSVSGSGSGSESVSVTA